jgi:hypothetical protein
VPAAKGDGVVIKSGKLIVMESDRVAMRDALSVTRTVKMKFPTAVGVPSMDPDGISVSPPGKDPEAIDQEYGGVPPLAVNTSE